MCMEGPHCINVGAFNSAFIVMGSAQVSATTWTQFANVIRFQPRNIDNTVNNDGFLLDFIDFTAFYPFSINVPFISIDFPFVLWSSNDFDGF